MTVRIDSVLKDAVNGAQQGLMNARRVSSQLAVASPEKQSTDEAMSKRTQSENQVNADARLVKEADQTLGSLVDVKA